MNRPKIRWAEIEYQPDFETPKPVVPLGVVVTVTLGEEKTAAWLILGREPNPENLPFVLKDIGPLGRSQLVGWGSSMARDIFEARGKGGDIFEHLASKWHWNLYVTDAEEVKFRANESLLSLARRLYEEHVGDRLQPAMPVLERPSMSRRSRRRWESAEIGAALPVAAQPSAQAEPSLVTT